MRCGGADPGSGDRSAGRRDKRFGVGMLRVGEDLLDGALLDDFALMHHQGPVAHVADNGEIMRYQQEGKLGFLAQIAQQLEDLRLHRDIEPPRRFHPRSAAWGGWS